MGVTPAAPAKPAPVPPVRAGGAARSASLALALITAAVVLSATLHLLYGSHGQVPADSTLITRVAAVELSEPTLAAAPLSGPAEIALPDKFCSTECQSTFKAYSTELPHLADDSALYLPFFDGAAAIYLNGELIDRSAALADPLQDTTYRPTLFNLPDGAAGSLTVLVSSVASSGGRLAPFYIGPRPTLASLHGTASTLTIGIPTVLLGILAVVAGIAALLFATGDRDRVYLWFVVLVGFVGLRLTDVAFPFWPATTELRHLLYLLTTLGVVLASAGFVSRLASQPANRFDLALLLLWLPLALLISIGLSQDFQANWLLANKVIGVTVVVIGVYTLLRFVHHSHRLPVLMQSAIACLLMIGLGLMLHDVWRAQINPPLLFPLSNLAAAPIVAAFAAALATRYGQLLRRANQSNAELKQAVEQARHELAESYEELSARRAREAIQGERHRLLRDVHDGVGGRLAALALRMRSDASINPAISSELDASVADLRLVIDSLDIAPNEDLGTLLGSMRERTTPWLALHGIDSSWRIDLTAAALPQGKDALSLCRVLQEALNNVVRHARATAVAVSANIQNDKLTLVVSDNGVSSFASGASNGRGLRIMRERAVDLGAELTIQPAADGTEVRLVLPVVATPDNGSEQTP